MAILQQDKDRKYMEEKITQGILFKLHQDKTEHLIKVIGVGGGCQRFKS